MVNVRKLRARATASEHRRPDLRSRGPYRTHATARRHRTSPPRLLARVVSAPVPRTRPVHARAAAPQSAEGGYVCAAAPVARGVSSGAPSCHGTRAEGYGRGLPTGRARGTAWARVRSHSGRLTWKTKVGLRRREHHGDAELVPDEALQAHAPARAHTRLPAMVCAGGGCGNGSRPVRDRARAAAARTRGDAGGRRSSPATRAVRTRRAEGVRTGARGATAPSSAAAIERRSGRIGRK